MKAWLAENDLVQIVNILAQNEVTTLADLQILENEDEIQSFAEEIGLENALKNKFIQNVMKLNGIQQNASAKSHGMITLCHDSISTFQILNLDNNASTLSEDEFPNHSSFKKDSYILSDVGEQLLFLIEFKNLIDLHTIVIHALPEICLYEKVNETSIPKEIAIFKIDNLNKSFKDIQEMKDDHSVTCKAYFPEMIKFQKKIKCLAIWIKSNQKGTAKTYVNGIRICAIDKSQSASLMTGFTQNDQLIKLSNSIINALSSKYHSMFAIAAKNFIQDVIETSEELVDDLKAGADDSALVHAIVNALYASGVITSFRPSDRVNLHSMLMQVINETMPQKQPKLDENEQALTILDMSTEKKAASSLQEIFHNLLANISDIDKYGNLNLAKTQKEFGRCENAFLLLKRVGFKEIKDRTRLIFDCNDKTLSLLNESHDALKANVNESNPTSTVLKLLDDNAISEDKAPWIEGGVDAWWNQWQNGLQSIEDTHLRSEILGFNLQVMNNLLSNLPEKANMTLRQQRLPVNAVKNTFDTILWMVAGFTECSKTQRLIFDHDDEESMSMLRRSYIRLKENVLNSNKQENGILASASGVKKSFAIKGQDENLSTWNCPLCKFLNEADSVTCATCGASRGPLMNEDLIKLGMDKDMNDLFATELVIANNQMSLKRVQCILRIYSLWIASPHRSDINIFDLIDVGLSPFYSVKRLLVDYKYLMKNEHEIFGYDGDNDTFVCKEKGECFLMNRYQRDRTRGDEHALFFGNNDEEYRQIFAQQSLDTMHAFIHHSVRINAKEMNVEEIRERYRQRDENKKELNEIKSKFVTTNKYKFDNETVIKMEESVDCFMDKIFDDLKLHKLESKTVNNLKNAMKCDEFETDSLRMDMKDNANLNIILWIGSLFPLRQENDLVIQQIESSISFLDNLQTQYSAGYRYFYWEYYKNNEDRVNVMWKPTKKIFLAEASFVEGNDGYRLMDWYIHRRYGNFKEEMLNNKTAWVGLSEWNATKTKTMQKYESWQSSPDWALKCGFMYFDRTKGVEMYAFFADEWFRLYGIPKYVQVPISHLMALLFYCNYTFHQNKLTATYRRIYWNETDKSLKRRHAEFYWWGRYLRELVECFGTCMQFAPESKFYHGINTELLFESTFFHGLLYLFILL